MKILICKEGGLNNFLKLTRKGGSCFVLIPKAAYIILGLFFITQFSYADDLHYINMLIGDRSAGMGGAYTAISDDPAGCFYNPAGIAFAASTNLSASVNAFNKSIKTYKSPLRDINGKSLDWEQESSTLLPNFFGMVRKIGTGYLGISYAVPDSTLKRQRQMFHNIQSAFDNNNIDIYTININDSDETYLFGPSYAYPFSDSFSIGLSLYAYYRDMDVIRNQLLIFEQGQHYLSNFYETRRDWGLNPILGAIWEPFDKLAIGLSFSKIYVTSSDKETQSIYRNTLSEDYNGTNNILFTRTSFDNKPKFPLKSSLGVAYFYSSRFLLSGDIIYYDSIGEKEALLNFAIGAEYYFTEALAARFGLYTDLANTPSLSSMRVNQYEHIDIYGLSGSLSYFNKNTGITLGMAYGYGDGEAQVISDDSTIQDTETQSLTVSISASYNL